MRNKIITLFAIVFFMYSGLNYLISRSAPKPGDEIIDLPAPNLKGTMSVEEALSKRRSVRKYSKEKMKFADLAQVLWAAQGVTKDDFFRTTPSAGTMYGLEVYVVVGNVENIIPGIYEYLPVKRTLRKIRSGDLRYDLADAALGQLFIEKAPATIILLGNYDRVSQKYMDRGQLYVNIEAGHAGQNIYLQATALGLGTCAVGIFEPNEVRKLINARADESPIIMYPVGNVLEKK